MGAIPERTSVTTEYGLILSRVAPHFMKGIHDQVFNDFAAWRSFSNRVKTIKQPAGEYYWTVDLATGVGDPTYRDLEVINTHRHDTETVAKVDTKEYFEQIAYSFRQRDKHRGDLAVAQNLAATTEKAMKRMGNALDSDLINSAGLSNARGILDFAQWLDHDPTSDTVAGINRGNVSAWANKTKNNGDAIASLLLHLRELFADCRSGARKPNLILANEMFVRALEGRYTQDINHNLPEGGEGKGRSGDGALTSVFYKGVPVVACENWTQYGTASGTGQAVLLNTDTWRIIDANAKSGSNMLEFVEEQRAPAQTAMVGGLRFHGEVICLEPRRNGVLFNVGDDA